MVVVVVVVVAVALEKELLKKILKSHERSLVFLIIPITIPAPEAGDWP